MSRFEDVFKFSVLSWTVAGCLLLGTNKAKADFLDYASGCTVGMGAGLVGAAFANTKLPEGQKVNASGYGATAILNCLVAMGFVGIVGSDAEFEATWKMQKENENLSYQLRRLSKERCLINATCSPGGRAIIVDTDVEIKKQGDKVFEVTTSTIEANE